MSLTCYVWFVILFYIYYVTIKKHLTFNSSTFFIYLFKTHF